jgi:hypothetical protein
MNSHPASQLADLQREYTGWRCWRGLSGTYYAIRTHHPPRSGYQLQATTPAELRERIHDADTSTRDLPIIPLGFSRPIPRSRAKPRRTPGPSAA